MECNLLCTRSPCGFCITLVCETCYSIDQIWSGLIFLIGKLLLRTSKRGAAADALSALCKHHSIQAHTPGPYTSSSVPANDIGLLRPASRGFPLDQNSGTAWSWHTLGPRGRPKKRATQKLLPVGGRKEAAQDHSWPWSQVFL